MRYLLALLLMAQPLAAAQLRDCDTWEANARNLAGDTPVRDFANGAIRLIALDTGGEPVCCSMHLMVVHPAGGDEPFQACTLISNRNDLGWAAMSLAGADATYDAEVGLLIAVPVGELKPDGSTTQGAINLTVNQANGTVRAE